jgi:hypothetical protein
MNKEDQRKEKSKGLDMGQIYGHGSQRGQMPGVSVPASCRQQASPSEQDRLENWNWGFRNCRRTVVRRELSLVFVIRSFRKWQERD